MMRSLAWHIARALWRFMEATDTRANHLLYPLYNRLSIYGDGPDEPDEPREGSR